MDFYSDRFCVRVCQISFVQLQYFKSKVTLLKGHDFFFEITWLSHKNVALSLYM